MGFVNSLFGWATVGVMFSLCVGFGWVAVSIPNPQFNVAQWAFTAAAIILILRLGLWISVEDAFGSISRWHTALISCLIFGVIGGTWIASLQWVDGLHSQNKTENNAPIIATRTAFSTVEKLRHLPPGMGGKEEINLDNVAVLTLLAPCTDDIATLLLDSVATSLPDQKGSGIDTTGTKVYTGYTKTITFDRFQNKRQEVNIGGRTFVVTLMQINHIAEPANLSWSKEYVFGITEK